MVEHRVERTYVRAMFGEDGDEAAAKVMQAPVCILSSTSFSQFHPLIWGIGSQAEIFSISDSIAEVVMASK
jgi:hypothetical protein